MIEAELPSPIDVRRGQAIIEYVSAGTAYLTGGWSEAFAIPIRRVIEKRLKELDEALLKEMRSGLIDESTVIDEDRLAAFVLRVRRAALEGTADKKLRIMARYFFRTAPLPEFSSDAAADFYAITEQLTDTDMRCLALMKHKRQEKNFDRRFDPNSEASPLAACDVDFADVFPDLRSFNEAAFALGRFGLVYSGTTADSTGFTLSGRGFHYIDSLDFDCIE